MNFNKNQVIDEGFKKALERSGHKVYWFHDKEYPDDYDGHFEDDALQALSEKRYLKFKE